MGTSCLGTFDIKESEVQPELSPHRPVKVGDNFRVLHTDKVLPIRGTSVHLSAGLANWKTWQQFDVRVLMNAGQFGNVSSFNWSHVQEKTLTLSHQLSSAFWRLSAEPVRWSLWSGTAAEDVLGTDVSTDVSVREYGMIHSSIHHTS